MVIKMKVKEMRRIRQENGDSCSDLGSDTYKNTFYRYSKDLEGNVVKTTHHTKKDAEMFLYFVGLTDQVERSNETHGTEYFQLDEEFVQNWLKSDKLSKQEKKFLKYSKVNLNVWRKIPPSLISSYKKELKSDRENILKDVKFPIKEVIVEKKYDSIKQYKCNVVVNPTYTHSFRLIKEDVEALDIKRELDEHMKDKDNRKKNTIKLQLSCSLMASGKSIVPEIHEMIPANAPRTIYYQGKKKKCTPYSLCSVLDYWCKINAKSHNKKIITIKEQIKDILNSDEMGTKLVTKCVQMMQRTGWAVKVYPIPKKKLSKIRKTHHGDIAIQFNPLKDREPPGSFLWGVLKVGEGITTHMVSICGDWIFDPNYLKAFPRTRKSLNICSDVTQSGYKYCGFFKLYIFTPTLPKQIK